MVHGYKLASKSTRLFAHITEVIIFLLVLSIIYWILGRSIFEILNLAEPNLTIMDVVYDAVLGLILGIIFYPLFTGNIGHRIFNLKVISAESGKDYKKPIEGGIRELLKHLLVYLIIPIIWILWDEKNQNLYDKLTKTYVVENNKIN